jgi:hypothetical protein
LPAGAIAAEPLAAPNQVWLLSTRDQGSICATMPTAEPVYWRMADDGQWIAADQKAFAAADDPAMPTVFFMHGNRTDRYDAVTEGWSVFLTVKQCAERPFRFVIWSWPADRIAGSIREDVQVKQAGIDREAYTLAMTIERIKPAVPVSLIGYSFGARMAIGSLQLAAGGPYAGLALPHPAARQTAMHAVLIAAAIDDDSLLPGHAAGMALSQVGKALITCNAGDPVLKRYPKIDRGGGPDALGYSCLVCPGQLGAEQQKLVLLNLCGEVGRHHELDCYLASPSLRARLASCVMP